MARQTTKKNTEQEAKETASNQRGTEEHAADRATETDEISNEELRAQFEALRQDVTRLSESLLRAGEERARAAMRNSGESAEEQARYAASQVELLLEEAEDFTRERPRTAMGLAMGAGFLLAMLLSRR